MDFFTRVNIPLPKKHIEHFNKIITIGSCFAGNIGNLLIKNYFNILNNPFGILYNPYSILNSLQLLVQNKKFTKDDLVYCDKEWHSFYHNSDFSSHDYKLCLEKINDNLFKTNIFIKQASFFIITFGTAFYYRHKQSGIIVSNCHKIPAAQFERCMIDINEFNTIMLKIIDNVRNLNPEINIILTISPIRYWSKEAITNQLSKAVLVWGVNKVYNDYDFIDYFPAYELLLDELRDYRFYKSDLIHPTEQAVDYIWNKFNEVFFSPACKKIVKEVIKIRNAYEHKPRNSSSLLYKELVLKQIEKIKKIKKDNSYLAFDNEIRYFNNILKNFSE